MEGGYHLTSYARVTFQFDTATDTVLDASYAVAMNEGGTADPIIVSLVDEWQTQADAELSDVIGYTAAGLPRRSPEMEALVVEAWLQAMPTAHVSITNLGGIRAAFAPGEITLGDVISVMPFNNVIVEVTLTGQQLLRVLAFAINDAAIGGVYLDGTQWRFKTSGDPLEPDQTYSLLVNDFMYAGGDGYELLAEFDPVAYNTAVDWRQPVIDWLTAQESSAERPLAEAIQSLMEVHNP